MRHQKGGGLQQALDDMLLRLGFATLLDIDSTTPAPRHLAAVRAVVRDGHLIYCG